MLLIMEFHVWRATEINIESIQRWRLTVKLVAVVGLESVESCRLRYDDGRRVHLDIQ
jgi:hypothetical protein